MRSYFIFSLIYYSIQMAVLYIGIFIFFIISCLQISGSSMNDYEGFISVFMLFLVFAFWLIALIVCWQFMLAVHSYKFFKSLSNENQETSQIHELADNQ